uniref:Uncharacterized protein n=1 Tax=Ciona intestinalis TaxID=7719 RepID=H2XZW3_CIOIN
MIIFTCGNCNQEFKFQVKQGDAAEQSDLNRCRLAQKLVMKNLIKERLSFCNSRR